jgi:citrate lyase beta subunit
MKLSLQDSDKTALLDQLGEANLRFQQTYPGDRPDRQPVHTVYGGANLFKADTCVRMGEIALRNLQTYAPNFVELARVLQLAGHEHLPTLEKDIHDLTDYLDKLSATERRQEPAWLAYTVYNKIVQKLKTEAVEDFRIDFEDGFGNRPDSEEDATAVQAAQEVAKGMEQSTLSPFIGIRIKPFTEDLKARGVRTLDIFLTTLLEATGGALPPNFVVMLPKVTIPEQMTTMVRFFELLEKANNLAPGTLKMETMVEATQIVMDDEGRNPLMRIIRASEGRCIAAHFGTYDYTASAGITAKYQTMAHPVCDFAHHMTKVALGGTGIFLSDAHRSAPRRQPDVCAAARKPGGRAQRLAPGLSPHHALAHQRPVPGLGPQPRAAAHALRGYLQLLSEQLRASGISPQNLRGARRYLHAHRRYVRRCCHRPRPTQLLPQSPELRCHLGRRDCAHRPHVRRNRNPVVLPHFGGPPE